ncbi:hypothetical protein GCM10010406_08820 [Streptomyces thermolineatus]|uniref:Uncharacterized protein n=1 Tax=Streptomyces thermolineatus TaxID=44033 RepID=A0ABN3L250_9ACTN
MSVEPARAERPADQQPAGGLPADRQPAPRPAADARPGRPARASDEQYKAPMGMTVRVFIYLVAVHFIVFFFFAIFYLLGAQ